MSTTTFKNADSILSVTLRKNQFSTDENSFIGRVTRNQEAVDSLKVDKVIIADPAPVFDRIINTFNQNENRILSKGKSVKVTGSRLKLLGEDSGLLGKSAVPKLTPP